MLVAYGPGDMLVIAGEISIEQAQSWSREQALRCPNCRGVVYARGGPEKQTQLHFAHQKGECAWSTEAESVRHMRGKVVLARWLREQFPRARVTLEERLPEPNRIADILVTHPDGRMQAVEFQCAPLDLEEWKHRHEAYRKANIIDTWIIGNNRREKLEAFIEAIIEAAREILFLDPLANPARCWLRWPVSREMVRVWQAEASLKPSFEGWVGHLGFGVTLTSSLRDVSVNEQGALNCEARKALETRAHMLDSMRIATAVDEAMLRRYLQPAIGEEALYDVIIPLMRAYLRDPELLRRYNYGRGQWNAPLNEADHQRVRQARAWLEKIEQRGYAVARLQELANEIPLVGPYAAFAGYIRMVAALI